MSTKTDRERDLAALVDPTQIEGHSVRYAAELLAFVDAIVSRDAAQITTTRAQLENQIGKRGVIDAACVVGNFERMNRIADATGIALDGPLATLTADLRDSLGINNYSAASETKPVGKVARWVGRNVGGLALKLSRRFRPPPK